MVVTPIFLCVHRFGTLLWDKDLVVAACLVPTFRLDWVRDYVSADKVDEAKQWIKDAAADLAPPREATPSPPPEEAPAAPSNSFHRFFG